MSSKPETTFIASVHRHLPHEFYREKMHNPYRGGTADMWYSGKRDIWIEYKFIARIPTSVVITPDVSVLQAEWLRNRHREGRKVFVIVGCKQGGVWLNPLEWERPMTPDVFHSRLQVRPALAERILATTQGRM